MLAFFKIVRAFQKMFLFYKNCLECFCSTFLKKMYTFSKIVHKFQNLFMFSFFSGVSKNVPVKKLFTNFYKIVFANFVQEFSNMFTFPNFVLKFEKMSVIRKSITNSKIALKFDILFQILIWKMVKLKGKVHQLEKNCVPHTCPYMKREL